MAAAGLARLDSVLGTADTDRLVLDALCRALPAEAPVARATAAAWTDNPPGSVLGGGGVNGVNLVADADEPA
ncbi:hypothetical protein NIIDMKKI_14380 [Mycobacterium kansasii]|nr:hypothetical protein NIIDMKKI_14380 [Mycobacterium kansasii]